MISIRPLGDPDWPVVWSMLHATFAAGETYSFAPDIGEAEARKAWLDAPLATFVAEEDGRVLGTYFIKANQPGLGAHAPCSSTSWLPPTNAPSACGRDSGFQ